MGQNPTGYANFLPEGRVFFILTGEGRKPAKSDQERADLLSTLVAYIGTYRIEGDKWITKVEVAWNPEWVGTEQARSFKIDGDRLQVLTPWRVMPNWADKGMTRSVVTFERANAQQTADPRVADLVRAGKVRFGTFPPQYTKDATTGELRGPWVEVMRALAAHMGLPAVLIELPTPSKLVECLDIGPCDVGSLGFDPARADQVGGFTPPFMQVEYTYLVPSFCAPERRRRRSARSSRRCRAQSCLDIGS